MYSKRDVDGRKQLEAQLKSRKSSQRLQLLISLLLEMSHGHAQVKVAG